jgi:hypothetical protein
MHVRQLRAFLALPPREDDRHRRPIAFVGGIDLTYDGGDPWDSPEHKARGGVGWHDLSTRLRGPIVADVADHFRLRWHGSTAEDLPPPIVQEPAGDHTAQIVRTIPESIYDENLPRGDFSVLESYGRAIRSAERYVYIENQFLWSPEIVGLLAEKLRNPPQDDFRMVVLLPVDRKRRCRHLTRAGGGAHPRRRRQRTLPRLLRVRTHGLPPRPRLRAREGCDRRRPLDHRGFRESQRALALQRLRGQRRRA